MNGKTYDAHTFGNIAPGYCGAYYKIDLNAIRGFSAIQHTSQRLLEGALSWTFGRGDDRRAGVGNPDPRIDMQEDGPWIT